MNRRKMLAVLGVGGLAASRGFTMQTAAQPEGHLALRLSKEKTMPFSVEEFGSDGKSAGIIRCDDERGLSLFLKRTAKDASAPKQLRFIAENGLTLERVWAGVKSCRAGGFEKVKYFGSVPPGCGILTGATPNQLKYDGTVLECEALEKILSENGTKC